MNALLLASLLAVPALADSGFSAEHTVQGTYAAADPAYVRLYEPKARLVVIMSIYGNPGDFGLERRDVYTMDDCWKRARSYELWDWGKDHNAGKVFLKWRSPVKQGWHINASCWDK